MVGQAPDGGRHSVKSPGRREFIKWAGVGVALLGGTWATVVGCGRGDQQPDGSPTPDSAGQTAMFEIGLYSWDEITYMPQQIQWLGLSYARIGGVVSDPIVKFCAENQINVLVTVTPETERGAVATDADFVAAYLAQLDSLLERYGPDGSFWKTNPTLPQQPITQVEIGNEPNFGYGFTGTTTDKAAQYAQILIASYNHIKTRWPTVTVVGFAIGGASNAAPGFFELVFPALQAAGQIDCFDAVSLHPYSADIAPEQMITEPWGTWVASESIDAVKQLMMKFGIDKPLWITETGYQISYADGGKFPSPADVHGNHGTVTLTQQAAYTIRLNMAAVRYGIARVYHMFVVDTDNYNGGWFGPSPAHEPRPVAVAMRQLISLIRGATDFEVVIDGGVASPASPFAYRFTTPRGPVMVAWCQTPGEFSLPLERDTDIMVTDMLGRKITTVQGSSYQAQLSETPIFLFPASAAEPK